MGAKDLYPKPEKQPNMGSPRLEEGEETKIVTFKASVSFEGRILDRSAKLKFKNRSAYIRHAIELEMEGGKNKKAVDRLTQKVNKYKAENIDLRNQIKGRKRN